MGVIQEHCSVCQEQFDVTFRYQMEERDGAFEFYCSQTCLKESQGASSGACAVRCDGCARRFTVKQAFQVLYTGNSRRYACSMPCRTQLTREAGGMRLGEIAAESMTPADESVVAETSTPAQRDLRPVTERKSNTHMRRQPAEAVPTVPAAPPAPAGASVSPPSTRTTAPAMRASRPVTRESESLRKSEPARSGPKRIAVFNHKGGTGKTTTSVSLAAGLADRGYSVLLLDTDSQGNVAVSLGAKNDRTLYHVLVMGLRVRDATVSIRPGLDLLPSNETLAAAELYLAGRQHRDRVLSQRIGSAADDYDYVIIDCSPSLSLMNQNALTFADSVLVPVACDYLSLVGVRQVIKTVKNVNALLRHKLQIWGVLPTMYDGRAKICREALGTLKSHFGERCLTPIRATTKLKEAPAQARSIFEHAPGSYGAEDYEALVDAVLAGELRQRKPAPRATSMGMKNKMEAMT